MKKTITILSIMLCFFGTTFEIEACSPRPASFKELLNRYNPDDYMVIEGYFQPATESRFIGYLPAKLMVTRSSHSSIKVGQEYEVFEYGPFGSMCERFEMRANVAPNLVGKKNLRLLIVFKARSINGKLVTPIFWQKGVNASNNKIVSRRPDYLDRVFYIDKCSTSAIRKRLFEGNTKTLKWKRSTEKMKK